MEIKQGDTVRVSKDAPRMYVSGLDHVYLGVDSTIIETEDGNAVIKLSSGNTNVFYSEKLLSPPSISSRSMRRRKRRSLRLATECAMSRVA